MLSAGRDVHGRGAIGLLVALFAPALVFRALPAGRLADRRGLRRPVGLSLAVATAGTFVLALWNAYPALGTVSIALQRHVGGVAVLLAQLRQVTFFYQK